MDAALADHLPELAIAAAIAWGAGIRLYAVLLLLGLAGAMGWFALPAHLEVLSHPLVMAASGFMALVELLADKVPWLDSLWDALHTFIRIPAGAALAAAVFGDAAAATTVTAAILGGTLAAGAHLAKAGARGAVNASPEPFSNWGLSLAEDALVPAGMLLAWTYPLLFLVLLAATMAGAFLFLRLIVRGLFALARRLRPA
ncbi:MAG: DUF4126 domain-containing protein [Burkholderiales bacterium]